MGLELALMAFRSDPSRVLIIVIYLISRDLEWLGWEAWGDPGIAQCVQLLLDSE